VVAVVRRCAEDDGYLLAYVHNPERGAADLIILAAQDFTAAPLARIHLPGRVPLGFHGSWVADACSRLVGACHPGLGSARGCRQAVASSFGSVVMPSSAPGAVAGVLSVVV
jgi:hypothetical protein